MKATVELTASALVRTVNSEKSLGSVLGELVKVRLTGLVLLTTLVGFYVGTAGPMDYGLMLQAVLGTALVACGAAALNQFWERAYDAKMVRTQDRPLPSGRLRPETALWLGIGWSALGLIVLGVAVNPLSSLVGGVTLAVYLFIYTPLKRLTWMNTLVGAVPGALPPVIGWAAAQNELSAAGWTLFAIMFFWQIPHFLAIAWLYREDYARARFRMLPNVDPDGRRTGTVAVVHTLALLVVSVLPVVFGLAGVVYLAGAVILGLVFLRFSVAFARKLSRAEARGLFYASIIYLPLLLILMVLDKANQ